MEKALKRDLANVLEVVPQIHEAIFGSSLDQGSAAPVKIQAVYTQAANGFLATKLDISDLSEIIQLSVEVFGASKYSKSEWIRRYREHNGCIVGVRTVEDNLESGVREIDDSNEETKIAIRRKGKIVCFIMAIERRFEHNINSIDSPLFLHIWMAATHPEYRKRGLFSRCYAMIEDIARKRGCKGMTLNTYPSKFPQMYRLATNRLEMKIVGESPAFNSHLTLIGQHLKVDQTSTSEEAKKKQQQKQPSHPLDGKVKGVSSCVATGTINGKVCLRKYLFPRTRINQNVNSNLYTYTSEALDSSEECVASRVQHRRGSGGGGDK